MADPQPEIWKGTEPPAIWPRVVVWVCVTAYIGLAFVMTWVVATR